MKTNNLLDIIEAGLRCGACPGEKINECPVCVPKQEGMKALSELRKRFQMLQDDLSYEEYIRSNETWYDIIDGMFKEGAK